MSYKGKGWNKHENVFICSILIIYLSCNAGDIMSESDDIVSSDEDDWEDLEEAKREEMSET